MEVLDKSDLVDKIKNLTKENVRFLISTAYYTDKDKEEIAIIYNFDKEGKVISYKVLLTDKSMPSLINVVGKAAEWCEREIHENYKVNFIGLDTTEDFILPDREEKSIPTFGTIKITKTEV